MYSIYREKVQWPAKVFKQKISKQSSMGTDLTKWFFLCLYETLINTAITFLQLRGLCAQLQLNQGQTFPRPSTAKSLSLVLSTIAIWETRLVTPISQKG